MVSTIVWFYSILFYIFYMFFCSVLSNDCFVGFYMVSTIVVLFILFIIILYILYFSVLFCPMTVLLDSIWLVQLCGSILLYSIIFYMFFLFCSVQYCFVGFYMVSTIVWFYSIIL